MSKGKLGHLTLKLCPLLLYFLSPGSQTQMPVSPLPSCYSQRPLCHVGSQHVLEANCARTGQTTEKAVDSSLSHSHLLVLSL